MTQVTRTVGNIAVNLPFFCRDRDMELSFENPMDLGKDGCLSVFAFVFWVCCALRWNGGNLMREVRHHLEKGQ